MTTETEYRVYTHLLRMVSVLMIIELDQEKGLSPIGLASTLRVNRQYLMQHCPALLLFTELCYRGQAIPEGLSQLAQTEAIRGRTTGL